jgi:putative photosynthetic complex assembly protein
VSDPFRDRPFPIGALIGAAALIGFSLLAVTVVRISGVGKSEIPPPAALSSVDLRFEDRADGGIAVYRERGDEIVEVYEPGTGGFVRGVLRAMARERRSHGMEKTLALRLSRREDGRLTLEDPATGRLVELTAFGPTNEEAFARLLPKEGTAQ